MAISKTKKKSPGTTKGRGSSTYKESGVDIGGIETGLSSLLKSISKTSANRLKLGKELVPNGYFASVLDLGTTGLALSTDGVGTKIIIAEMMDKYDTVGIDLIAMNVNDILSVGAEPIAMLDYVAIEEPREKFFRELGKGLLKGSNESGISIPAGEIAQVKDIIKGTKPGMGFDLVGTAVGVVDKKKIIVGQKVKKGDVLIGLQSSGLHSNGYTLARKVLLPNGEKDLKKLVPGTKKAIGDELLTPTKIYVKGVLELLKKGLDVKALTHITGDGFLNLLRSKVPASYVIDALQPEAKIYDLIRLKGDVTEAELFRVFNMGTGFVITIAKEDVDAAIKILNSFKYKPSVIGYIENVGPKIEPKVVISEKGLVGRGKEFSLMS